MSVKYPKYERYSSYDKKKKAGYYERLVNLFKNIKRILVIANKPSRKEYWMVTKIILIGITLLGALSYVIQLIFTVVLPLGR